MVSSEGLDIQRPEVSRPNDNWRWQLSHAVSGTAEFARTFGVKLPQGGICAGETHPLLATPYFLNLIDRASPLTDPIFRQIFPDGRELSGTRFLSRDPLGEEAQSPVPGLVRRYKDRAIVLVTPRCAVHCRFCFRKRVWERGAAAADIGDSALRRIASFLRRDGRIRELILSGGDPLLLETERLAEIISLLRDGTGVELVRIGTRVPGALPMRVDRRLARMMGRVPGLWVAAHFNHPRELSPQAAKACSTLVGAGVPMLSQTVLLSGINDDSDTLEELFRGLLRLKVKPYYLFHCDPVEGSAHFRTGVRRGLKIIRELSRRLPFHAVPAFAIDLPGGGGKYHFPGAPPKSGRYRALDGRKIFYPE